MSGRFEHRIRVQIRYRDIDRLGHLNQAVYHEFLEEVRGGLVTELMRRTGTSEQRGAFVVARVELDYGSEVRKDHDEVEVVARVAHVGNSSMRIDHEILLADGTVAASGLTIVVAWDRERRCKRSISDAERAAVS
jgi:acyl-CoA thioester hydrolase